MKIALSINASWNVLNFRQGLIRALRAAEYEIVVFTPPDEAMDALAGLGVSHRPLAMSASGTSPARDVALLLRYVRALRRERPDIYLGYTAKPNIYGSLAAQILGIPVINNISGLGTAFMKPGLLNRIVSQLYRAALRRSYAVFFQNAEDRELFVGRGLVSAKRGRVLPGSGIDLARFSATTSPHSPGGSPAFLLIARLLRDKGVVEFVEAARVLRETHPDARFQLLGFLGVDNRTAISRAEVDAWVAEGIVDYLGDTDDVRPFIAAADCVVLPSYREGLPRTLLEAGAMARPLIATDVPGCRQVVDDGVNGFLCAARDAESLAAAMRRMIEIGPEARVEMGAAARSKVEREFDERIVIDRYLEAIDAALSRRSAIRL